nr:rod shape-determining protein MreC [Acidihalobacter ferrooxydans]
MKQPLFNTGPALHVKTLILVLLSVALMTADQRYSALHQARYYLEYAVAPVRALVVQPERLVAWMSVQLESHQRLLTENQALRRQNLLLAAGQQKYAAILAENARLRQLLNASKHTQSRVKVARLLSIDLAPYTQRIVINQGKQDGAYVGQPVIDANGLLGQIIQVGPFSSEVLLISDPGSAVPVIDLRSGLRLLAVGIGQTDELKLRSAANTADIRVGDRIVTSGLGGRFPADYPVCTVSAIVRTPGDPFSQIACTPAAALGRYREVLLIWNTNASDRAAPAAAQPNASKP